MDRDRGQRCYQRTQPGGHFARSENADRDLEIYEIAGALSTQIHKLVDERYRRCTNVSRSGPGCADQVPESASTAPPTASTRRQQQAVASRQQILGAARRLFVERGYGPTTVEAVAEAAGVAVPTLYVTFGGKRGILPALIETIEQEDVGTVRRYDELIAEPDPKRRLQLLVAIHHDFVQFWDVFEALRTAAAVDPNMHSAWREGEARRHRDQQLVVRSLARDGALRSDLDEARAADILWYFAGPESYRHLAVERGWSMDVYEKWLGDTLIALLLR